VASNRLTESTCRTDRKRHVHATPRGSFQNPTTNLCPDCNGNCHAASIAAESTIAIALTAQFSLQVISKSPRIAQRFEPHPSAREGIQATPPSAAAEAQSSSVGMLMTARRKDAAGHDHDTRLQVEVHDLAQTSNNEAANFSHLNRLSNECHVVG
jgi:hypothetical protein